MNSLAVLQVNKVNEASFSTGVSQMPHHTGYRSYKNQASQIWHIFILRYSRFNKASCLKGTWLLLSLRPFIQNSRWDQFPYKKGLISFTTRIEMTGWCGKEKTSDSCNCFFTKINQFFFDIFSLKFAFHRNQCFSSLTHYGQGEHLSVTFFSVGTCVPLLLGHLNCYPVTGKFLSPISCYCFHLSLHSYPLPYLLSVIFITFQEEWHALNAPNFSKIFHFLFAIVQSKKTVGPPKFKYQALNLCWENLYVSKNWCNTYRQELTEGRGAMEIITAVLLRRKGSKHQKSLTHRNINYPDAGVSQ